MMLFLELRQGKNKIVLNAADIVVIYPGKKKGSYIITDWDELEIEVDDTPDEIIHALTRLDLVRKASNV